MSRGRLVALIVVVAGIFSARAAHALHRESPPTLRITSGAPHHLPPTRSWANYLAFPSTVDLLGNGSTGRQVFVWNLADFDCNRGTTKARTPCAIPPRPDLVQVTDGTRPGSPDNGSVTANGSLVAYDADGIYAGQTGLSGRHRQMFLQNMQTGELVQVTQSPGGDTVRGTLSRSGTVLVFESTAPLLGRGPRGVSQIFVYFALTRKLIQLTEGAGPSSAAMPNASGGLVVFESTADLLGDGHDTGISQIFVATVDKNAQTSTLAQITKGNAPSRRPFIMESKAARAVFESTATDFAHTNPAPGTTIYSAPANGANLPPLRQHTDATYGSCSWPSIDAGHIAVVCDGDPLQNGTTGPRLFLIDTSILSTVPNTLPTPIQLTGRGEVSGPLAKNLGLFFVVFSDTADLSGTGGCGPQVQVIDYAGIWHGASAPGELPLDVLPPLPPPPPDPSTFPDPQSNLLGTFSFEVLPPSESPTGGSAVTLTTRNGVALATTRPGRMEFHLAPHDVRGESDVVAIPTGRSWLPPLAVPGTGVLCLDLAGNGEGVLDCDGGRPGGDIVVTQDHETRDVDPGCVDGCPEDGACQGPLPGPHTESCGTCPHGEVSACNGPVTTQRTGALRPGGLQMFMPLRVHLSINAGIDGVACTSDDTYQFRNLTTAIELTTESASGSIQDADAVSRAILPSPQFFGTPLDCAGLKSHTMATLTLQGVVPLLDLPGAGGPVDGLLAMTIDARFRPLPPLSETSIGDPCVSSLCHADAECDDGNPCDGVESCANEACLPGVPRCDDGDPCDGLESCDPATGACTPGPPLVCDDVNVCTFDTCVPGEGCVFVDTCDDENVCNGAETCDTRTGACGPGTPIVCNDDNACTDDRCDPVFGCEFVPNRAPCDDGDRCTTGDVCAVGACTGTPVSCADGDRCNGDETCDPGTGACVAGTPPVCDDGNACTDDSCDPATGCQNVPNVAPCDDQSACTTNDVCSAGTCAGTPTVFCDDGDACNGTESCDPTTGTCVAGAPPTCDDGNPCTDDACVPGTGCTNVPNTATCDDGNACTNPDTCQGGVCVGVPAPCSDNNICNGVEDCDPATNQCVVVTPPPDCDDGDSCTQDICDPLAGCQHIPSPDPTCVPRSILAKTIEPAMSHVQDASTTAVGGEAVRERLMRLLTRMQTQLEPAKNARRGTRRRLRVVGQRLQAFIALVDTTRASGTMDPTLADWLIAKATAAMDQIRSSAKS